MRRHWMFRTFSWVVIGLGSIALALGPTVPSAVDTPGQSAVVLVEDEATELELVDAGEIVSEGFHCGLRCLSLGCASGGDPCGPFDICTCRFCHGSLDCFP